MPKKLTNPEDRVVTASIGMPMRDWAKLATIRKHYLADSEAKAIRILMRVWEQKVEETENAEEGKDAAPS